MEERMWQPFMENLGCYFWNPKQKTPLLVIMKRLYPGRSIKMKDRILRN